MLKLAAAVSAAEATLELLFRLPKSLVSPRGRCMSGIDHSSGTILGYITGMASRYAWSLEVAVFAGPGPEACVALPAELGPGCGLAADDEVDGEAIRAGGGQAHQVAGLWCLIHLSLAQ